MFKNEITISRKFQCSTRPSFWVLWLAFFVLLVRFSEQIDAAETNNCGNSCGFIFDHFNLTLEQGYRTEAAGPFYYSQQTEDENTSAFPPFFSHVRNPSIEYTNYDILYPLLTRMQYGQEWRWQFFQLISFSGGHEANDATKTRHTFFPIYFSQRSTTDTNLNYTAVFPFYGTIKNRLSRDQIFVVMFPLYSETRKKDVITDNYLYPFGSIRNGDGMHGWKIWPLAGRENKIPTLHTNGFGEINIVAGYERSFYLWPLCIIQDNRLGTNTTEQISINAKASMAGHKTTVVPEKFRASIPFFVYSRSPELDLTTVIWPFFSWIDAKEKKYHEWQGPWPFVIFARGEGKTTSRVFPLFQTSHNAIKESDFILWPLYTYKATHSDPLDYRRTRVAFYLYENTLERSTQTGIYKHRVDMWPFFTWHRDFNGNERLQVLALLEPVLPDNDAIERNWSPLWSLWRAENNPKTGAASHSLLWNLYRSEATPAHKKVSLLFGLFQYQCDGEVKRTKLFYLTVSKTTATAQ